MESMKARLLIILSLISLSVAAQFTDKELYNAYLRQDMSVWHEYIQSADFDLMNVPQQLRLLNYEYGYVAAAIGAQLDDAEQHLLDFQLHIDAADIPESFRYTYLSAAAAFAITFNKSKFMALGMQTIRFANKAVEVDSLNPFALSLKANTCFYAPKVAGGDKNKALHYFQRAEQIFKDLNATENNWNYRIAQLGVAQCYEQLGQKEKAIEKCKDILAEEPDFEFVRDTFLPKLLQTK